MSDDIQISIEITIEGESAPLPNPEIPTQEDRLRCEMWATCESAHCFKHGCLNALMNNSSEVRS